jgi:hypothetical protein
MGIVRGRKKDIQEREGAQDTQVAPLLPERAPSEGPRSTAAIGATWVPCRDKTETVQKRGRKRKERGQVPSLDARS